MKKLILLLFILPIFCFAQTNVTPQWKKFPVFDSLGYSITGSIGNHWLYDAHFIRVNYLTKSQFTDSLRAHKIYFTNNFQKIGDTVDLNNSIRVRDTGYFGKSVKIGDTASYNDYHLIVARRTAHANPQEARIAVRGTAGASFSVYSARDTTDEAAIVLRLDQTYPSFATNSGTVLHPIPVIDHYVGMTYDTTTYTLTATGGASDSTLYKTDDSIHNTDRTVDLKLHTLLFKGKLATDSLGVSMSPSAFSADAVNTSTLEDNSVGVQPGAATVQSYNPTVNAVAEFVTNSLSPSLGMIYQRFSDGFFKGISIQNGTNGITIDNQIDGYSLIAAGSIDTAKMTSTPRSYVTADWVTGKIAAHSGGVTSITPGYGFTSSTPITTSGTMTIDTTKLQTVLNFFPKGDTRYYKSSNPSGYISTNQTISFAPTGDVTGSTTGTTTLAPALTIGASKVTNTMLAGSIDLTTKVTGLLPVANGGTGTATPGIVAGTNVTVSGTWPNQTVNASGGSSLTAGRGILLPSTAIILDTTQNYNWLKAQTITKTSLGTTQTLGLMVQNSTAAALGAQQISPYTEWASNSWSTALGASTVSAFRAYALPVQKAAGYYADWHLQSTFGGSGAWTDAIVVSGDGVLTVTSAITSGNNISASNFFGNGIARNAANVALALQSGTANNPTVAGDLLTMAINTTTSNSSGVANTFAMYPNYNQSSGAGYRGLWISAYEQAVGSGVHYLIDVGTGSASNGTGTYTSKWFVDDTGNEKALTSFGSAEITYANRPSTPYTGQVCNFSDSTVNTWGATIAGTGSNHVAGRYNGTNWTVIGI